MNRSGMGLAMAAATLLACGGASGGGGQTGAEAGRAEIGDGSCEPEGYAEDGQGRGEEAPSNLDEAPVPATPIFERGLVVPRNSIPCVDEEGAQSWSCNHHGSSVVVAGDGEVLAVWYHGRAEKSKDSAILWARRPAGGEFGPAEVLFDEPDRAEGNPAIWIDEAGRWYLFFVTILGESWNDAEIRLITSDDRGATWSPVKVLRREWRWMVRNRPVRMAGGELLLPLYDESLYMPSFMISTDDFNASWSEIAFDGDAQTLLGHLAMIQPTVVRRQDGELWALCRNTGIDHGMAVQMSSTDNGRTWSAGSASAIPNDSTGIEMVRLASHTVALAFNNTLSGRYPLSVALSEDEGRTWTTVVDLDGPCPPGEGCSHGYTAIAQDPTDHSIWISYTEERETIGWVHLNESWLHAQESVELKQHP